MRKTRNGLLNPSSATKRLIQKMPLNAFSPFPPSRPRALREGGTIGICAPSGFLPLPEKLPLAVNRLESHGYKVVVTPSVLAREGYCAGSAESRLADLHRLVEDPSIDMIMAARGGFGLSHLLPRIDWKACASSQKLFCGFSDFTAFHLALYSQTGQISLAGPMAVTDFAGSDESTFHSEHFWNLVSGQGPAKHTYPIWQSDQSLQPQKLEGIVWGGNLSLIAHLMGTPWFPQIEGGILFLEDIGEAPYRIERMLMQLELSGILAKQSAIVLGAFTGCAPPEDAAAQYYLSEVITGLRKRFSGPVITGLPFGHIKDKFTLPFGAVSSLILDGLDCRLSVETTFT